MCHRTSSSRVIHFVLHGQNMVMFWRVKRNFNWLKSLVPVKRMVGRDHRGGRGESNGKGRRLFLYPIVADVA